MVGAEFQLLKWWWWDGGERRIKSDIESWVSKNKRLRNTDLTYYLDIFFIDQILCYELSTTIHKYCLSYLNNNFQEIYDKLF